MDNHDSDTHETVSQAQVDERFARPRYNWHLETRADDIEFIRETLRSKLGVTITAGQAAEFWEWHSDMYAAGWLIMLYNTPELAEKQREAVVGYFREFLDS